MKENITEVPRSKDFEFSGRGEIYSFTTVYYAPARFKEFEPYTVALIELEEGPLITAQLTDFGDEKPEIGMPVEMVTRKLFADGKRGVLIYKFKFRPLFTHKDQSK
jgi:uncharacterized OB-fold protein